MTNDEKRDPNDPSNSTIYIGFLIMAVIVLAIALSTTGDPPSGPDDCYAPTQTQSGMEC